jgi:hypothetical protein
MTLLRALVSGVCALGTFYFASLFVFSWIPGFSKMPWLAALASLACAAAVFAVVWKKTETSLADLVTSVLLGAAIFGAIGFAAGFFGPMILSPDANQGPLLGIFITGPIGGLIGAFAGVFYWFFKGRKRKPSPYDFTDGAPPSDAVKKSRPFRLPRRNNRNR